MTATCDTCGATIEAKNAAGHYRDTCPDCIQAVADARTPANAHDCAECGDPAVGRPDGMWLCAGCWVGSDGRNGRYVSDNGGGDGG